MQIVFCDQITRGDDFQKNVKETMFLQIFLTVAADNCSRQTKNKAMLKCWSIEAGYVKRTPFFGKRSQRE